MKKLATLLLAAGMVLGSFAGAQAIDWKAKGEWIFEFSYSDGIRFARDDRNKNVNPTTIKNNTAGRAKRYGSTNGADNFEAIQRVRLQLDAVASENLSGTLHIEVGDQRWGTEGVGRNGNGAALGADGVVIEVKGAYLDWIVPNTDLKIRMGIQPLGLPSYTFESAVFNDDVAGISASYKFNDNVSLVAFWARPFNDNYTTSTNNPYTGNSYGSPGYMDNVDVFGLVLPLAFDGFKITPWGVLGFIGPNFYKYGTAGQGDQLNNVLNGMLPAYSGTGNRYWFDKSGNPQTPLGTRMPGDYATAWWAGLTGEITALDPFRFAWDANYGSTNWGDKAGYLNRSGWFVNILAEYKLDWGVPGLLAWWGSGDDSNPKNGSERMPVFSIDNNGNNGMSSFGFGQKYSFGINKNAPLGSDYAGTWGIGVRIRDMSFIEDLSHTFRVNFFGGTNDPTMAKYLTGKKSLNKMPWDNRAAGLGMYTDFNGGTGSWPGPYLTTQDYGLEINLDTAYKIYENLEVALELGYIHLWLDQSKSVWGAGYAATPYGTMPTGTVRGINYTDAIKASLVFRYAF